MSTLLTFEKYQEQKLQENVTNLSVKEIAYMVSSMAYCLYMADEVSNQEELYLHTGSAVAEDLAGGYCSPYNLELMLLFIQKHCPAITEHSYKERLKILKIEWLCFDDIDADLNVDIKSLLLEHKDIDWKPKHCPFVRKLQHDWGLALDVLNELPVLSLGL